MDSNWKSINNHLHTIHQDLFRAIPGIFHSFETGEAFRHCTGCGKDLGKHREKFMPDPPQVAKDLPYVPLEDIPG